MGNGELIIEGAGAAAAAECSSEVSVEEYAFGHDDALNHYCGTTIMILLKSMIITRRAFCVGEPQI